MKRHPNSRWILSAPILRARQRLRTSWLSWSLTRTTRQHQKAQRRLTLLLLETDSQLLRTKELHLQVESLQHRQQETLLSRQFRLEGKLSQQETPPFQML